MLVELHCTYILNKRYMTDRRVSRGMCLSTSPQLKKLLLSAPARGICQRQPNEVPSLLQDAKCAERKLTIYNRTVASWCCNQA